MRIFRYCLIFTVVFCAEAVAQVGNEWIVFGQPYFKIPVAREGIYKLGFAELQAAGFPAGAVDPARIQLFHRGIEQAIYIEGDGDGQFDPTDFIEFYGQKNDGTLDAQLYSPASSQPHGRYNLYSDTTSYFLTFGALSGKRMPSFYEENTGGLLPEASHTSENLLLLTAQYSTGIDYGEIQKTVFDLGEGWTGGQILQNQFKDYTLTNIRGGVASSGPPALELLLVGRGPMQHQGEVYVGTGQRLVASFNFAGYEAYKFSQPISWSDIAPDGTLAVRIKVVGVGGQPDRLSASYILLKYPQQFDFAGDVEKTFILPANPVDKTYIQLENPPSGLRLFDVTDPANITRIGTTANLALGAIVPSTSTSRTIYASNLVITPGISAVSFREIFPSQHNYIIISHPFLRKPALGYGDPVKAYAEYRASPEGGSYDTLVVNIQQLYDQFNYGESSPLAIFHFMKFLANVKLPQYLLLVGKGLDWTYNYYRNPSGFTTFKDFVPSAGFPGADIAYTAGLGGTVNEPAVPTGRIPALRAEDVAAYLDKVKEMEVLPYDMLWRKDVLHLSGGIYDGEPQQFKDYMKGFQAIAEDYHFGGNVSAIAKYAKEIQHINVAEQVNNGLNLMTFFGHSSASTTDFEIGYVTDPVQGYNNKGKYPVLLMNGCNAGSSYLTYTIFGEDWLLAKDRGAIGFIAHSAYGFAGLLKKYTETFYAVGFQDSVFITKGIGDIQKETARRYMQSATASPANITQVQQMILLGDPAVRLFGAPKADLEITEDNVSIESFDGQPITALTDSFAVNMIIRNFGQAKKNTYRIEVQRTLNDNSIILYDSLFEGVKYSDSISFVIRKGRETGFGNNSFQVTLDPDDVVPELTKENNVATKGFFISLNGTKNLFPANYGIVKSQEVTLTFQTTDLRSGEREFLVELDTVNTFDSPFKTQVSVNGKVYAKHVFTLLASDTTPYYWRTRLAQPQSGEQSAWTQSSFTYIENGPSGWAQVEFPQYLENQTIGLVKDVDLKRLKFLESITSVSVKTFGGDHPAPFTAVSVKIAGAEYNLYGPGYDCRDNSINLIAFDRKSTVPYTAVQFEWFNRAGRNCGRKPWVINNYIPSQMVTGNNDDIIQYVDNVPDGDSVVIYSIGNAGYSAWPAAAKTKFGELGISVAQIDALQDGEPVIIFGRKGIPPGAAKVFVASGSPKEQQELRVDKTITGGYTTGSMNSTLIGPATRWESFFVQPAEIEAEDQVSFDVVGTRLNGDEEIILNDVTGDQDLSLIDATEFPYLRVAFNAVDETNLTATQLNKWLVTFIPAPEGLLVFDSDRDQVLLQEGERWQGTFGFVNITDESFPDSVTVRYEVFNHASRRSQLENFKIKAPILQYDTSTFTVQLNTTDKSGLNDVEVFVNPRLVPEQYYDNNALQLNNYINVESDFFNPVLDVSVDGRHITDGDFVSPSPLILARIWDENEHILKMDTTGVRIFLTYPCNAENCVPTPILLTNEEVTWQPATDTSTFNIEFRPKNLVDGEYKLRIEVADAQGNKSGSDPYEINFLVEDETTISISEPYPNPFSEAAFVAITISGSTLPDQFDFQVVDVNGQMESHFGDQDFPTFHIGTNVLRWKGNNINGNPLPNGVYIYKLSILLAGEQITKIGKLVLVR